VSRPQRPSPRQIRRRRRAAAALLGLSVVAAAYLVLRVTVLAPADTHGARVLHLTIHSRAVGEDLGVTVVIPPGRSRRRPLLVFLHGRGGSGSAYTEDEAMFEALARLGRRAPVIAFPDGGDHGYWHNRAEGNWGNYVVDEVIPLAAREGDADPHRVAIGGISMGGFGAYDIALKHPGRFCAVGGHSPALWLRAEDTAPGAFDNAGDFERNNVIAKVRADPGAFGGIPIWNDAGTEDPFLIADVAFDNALEAGGADITAHDTWPGGHNSTYWDEHWGAYLSFYAQALASC
jgi:S-formylglutathione hydrolase FrmB